MIPALLTSLLVGTANLAPVGIESLPPTKLSGGSTNTYPAIFDGCYVYSNVVSPTVVAPSWLLLWPTNSVTNSVALSGDTLTLYGSTLTYSSNGHASVQTLSTVGKTTYGTVFDLSVTLATNEQRVYYNFLSYTNAALTNDLNTNCLAGLQYANLVALTNGEGFFNDGGTLVPDFRMWNISSLNGTSPTMEINSNFVFMDVANIWNQYMCYTYNSNVHGSPTPPVGTFGNYWQISPISPHFCVTAWHVSGTDPEFTNRIYACRLPNGLPYTNGIVGYGDPTNGDTDLMIVLMSSANPFYDRVAGYVTNWWSPCYSNNPVCFRTHGQGNGQNTATGYTCSFTSCMDGTGDFGPGVADSSYPTFDGDTISVPFGDYSTGDEWVSGDSSSPAGMILNNEYVLLGCAHGGYGSDEAPVLDTNTVNYVMKEVAIACGSPYTNEMCTPYPMQTIPTIQP